MKGKWRKETGLLLALLVVLVWAGYSSAAPLSFTGTVSYDDPAEGEETTRYYQSTNAAFDQSLTPLMRLSESLRYSSTWEEGTETESIMPYADLRLNNDLFLFNLSGNASKQRNSETSNRTNSSWDARWSSNWQKQWVPDIQFDYGQNFSVDDESPRRQDTESTDSGFRLDWDLLLANIYYSIDRTESDDLVRNSNNISTNQLARFDTEKSFLQDSLRLTFSEQYTSNKQSFTSRVNSSGFAQVPVVINQSWFGWVTDVFGNRDALNPDPDVSFPDNDPDFDSQVEENERYNIVIDVDSRQVDEVYLTTNIDISDDAADFQWDVYSSTNGATWFLVQSSVISVYNELDRRFELQIPELHVPYIMLVEESIPDFGLDPVPSFTGVSAFSHIAETDKVTDSSETEYFLTTVGAGWRINPQLNLVYNIAIENGTTATDENDDSTRQNFSLGWNPHSSLSSSFSAGETRDKRGDDEETMSRSYGVNTAVNVLPTLDMSFGATRSESYEGGDKTSTSHNFNWYTTALLFPDLTSSLDLGYNTSLDEETDLETRSFNSNLRFTARLTPRFTAEFSEQYSNSHAEDNSWYAASRMGLLWRPSDILSFNGTVSKDWTDGEASELLYNASVSLALTRTMQTNFNYNHAETSDSYSLNWNWTVNRVFSVRADCRYLDDQEGSSGFSWGGQITMRY